MSGGSQAEGGQPVPGFPDDESPAAVVSRLFRDNNTALLNFLLTQLANEHEAREVAQEAYVKLLQLDRPEAISYLRTYLFRIAANLAIDRKRRGGRKDRIEQLEVFEEWSQDASVEREVLAEQELSLLKGAIRELKPKYQRAFMLHKFSERPVKEVAVEMGITPRMVRSYITRAVFYCRLRLDGYGVDDARKAMKELPL